MTTDNTNETEELKSGPIDSAEVDQWEQALSRDDKIQLRRLQLQQASINRAAAQDKERETAPGISRTSRAQQPTT
jgi:hypothetical protein